MIRSGNREYVDVREQVMIYWQKKHKESASAEKPGSILESRWHLIPVSTG